MTANRILCSLAASVLAVTTVGAQVMAGLVDLSGAAKDPFLTEAKARVFLFVRSDCPLTNRYAPELQRISREFASQGAEFWLVYPDPSESAASIRKHVGDYGLPGAPLRDLRHTLVARAHATVSPEAAVFDSTNALVYTGRIDDRFIDFGKSRPAPTTHDLEQAITAALAHKPVALSHTKAVGCYLADIKPLTLK